MTLFELTAEFRAIEAALFENEGELTPELEEALTVNAQELEQKADNYGAFLQYLQSVSDACANEVKRVQKIKRTADNGAQRMKDNIKSCMECAGIPKIDGTTHKFSLRKSTAMDVDEEALIHPYAGEIEALSAKLPEYLSIEVKVSKTALKEASKVSGGILPEGAQIVENKSLIVK